MGLYKIELKYLIFISTLYADAVDNKEKDAYKENAADISGIT
jgi:hypothetical protein